MKPAICLLCALVLVGDCLAQHDLVVYANAVSNTVRLNWIYPSGTSSVDIYSSAVFDTPYVYVATVSSPTQSWDRSLIPPTEFFYLTDDLDGTSDTVGYSVVDVPGVPGTPVSKSFGIPFSPRDLVDGVPVYSVASTKPSDIIHEQANAGTMVSADRVVRQGGDFAFRNTAGAWVGALETNATPDDMIPGRAYWYVNKSGTSHSFSLAGPANWNAVMFGVWVPAGSPQAPSAVAVAFMKPLFWPREWLGLLTDGFKGGSTVTSDRLVEQQGAFCYYNTSSSLWAGTLQGVTPALAYTIVSKHSPGWWYTFDYGQP